MENFFSWLLIFAGLFIIGNAAKSRFVRYLCFAAAIIVTLYFGLSAVGVLPGI